MPASANQPFASPRNEGVSEARRTHATSLHDLDPEQPLIVLDLHSRTVTDEHALLAVGPALDLLLAGKRLDDPLVLLV